ncbi:MAG: hypothetical protein U0234_33020 [Sandaracinus sp.]
MSEAAPASMPTLVIPLHLRAPNPPEPFLGRAVDLAWLRARRVAVVLGPTGWGKSALVAAHVAVPGLVLRLEARGEPRVPLAARVLRALAAALGIATGELGRVEGDDAVARAIDLADAADATLWVDDVAPDDDDAALLIALAARYARRARVYATALAPLSGVPVELHLSPSPLGLAELVALVDALDPSLTEAHAQRLARLAEGSPGALRTLRLGGSPLPVSAAASRGLALLRASRVGIPIDALTDVVGQIAVDELLAHHAVRSGPLVRATPGSSGAPAADDLRALIVALDRHGSSESRLEAVRLALAAEDVRAAAAILSSSIETLLAEGYAPELWEALERREDVALTTHRLRVAAEHGSPSALGHVEAPAPGAPMAAAFAWLKAHYAREAHGVVRQHGRALAERAEAEGATELAWELWLMSAASAMAEGAFDEAGLALRRAAAPHERAALAIRAMRALLASRRGEREEAASLAASLDGRLDALTGRNRAVLTYNLGLVLYQLGRPDRAAELFERTFPIDDLSTAALLSRRALELDAHLSVLGGRFARAHALLDRLAKFVMPGTPIEGRRVLIEATLAFATGALAVAAQRVERGVALARVYEGREDLAYGQALAAQIAWRSDEAPATVAPGATPSERLAVAWHATAEAAYHGASASFDGGTPELDALARARALLIGALEGDEVGELGTLVEASLALPAVPTRSAMLLLAYQIAWLAGRTLEVPLPEPEQALVRAAQGADVPALVALSARDDMVGRLASGLVGGEGPRGALGRRLLATAREQLGWLSARRTERGGVPVHVDGPRGRIFDGPTSIDLGHQPVLLRVLAALARDGEADKETLVRAVWPEVREYHPLKHDNRLRLAVKKLRRKLTGQAEARRSIEPESSALIVTRTDGYALARSLVWLGPS